MYWSKSTPKYIEGIVLRECIEGSILQKYIEVIVLQEGIEVKLLQKYIEGIVLQEGIEVKVLQKLKKFKSTYAKSTQKLEYFRTGLCQEQMILQNG